MSFSGFVFAEHGGELFLQRAGTIDGTALPTRNRPYYLASVGKVFTAVAIGQLVDQGKVKFDAPISTYLPNLPGPVAGITVEQLVRHQSGISDQIEMTPEMSDALARARSARDLLPLVVNKPLAFPPGTQTRYSNGGYFILGAIIEAASGRNYGDYLKSAIFAPLGMTNSSLEADTQVAVSMSRMQGPDGPPLDHAVAIRGHEALVGNPAGDSVSTASDLAKLARALLGHGLLSDATKDRLFPKRPDGWRIGQAGGREGANTYFMVYPDRASYLIVLSNYDPPGAELMGAALGGMLSGQPCHPLTEAEHPSPMRLLRSPPNNP